jgi:hypothetical protein
VKQVVLARTEAAIPDDAKAGIRTLPPLVVPDGDDQRLSHRVRAKDASPSAPPQAITFLGETVGRQRRNNTTDP